MNTNSRQSQSNHSSETTPPVNSENFDLWAKEVKRQMIASLKKRDYRD